MTSYLEDALADGWQPDARHDYRFHRDGFTMDIHAGEATNIWGPDRLAIKVPSAYDWDAIQAGTKRCQYCGPAIRAKIEAPGWCD
jgi:hypothetical protein